MTASCRPAALTRPDELAPLLAAKGLSPAAARTKAELFARAAAALHVPRADEQKPHEWQAYFVPGRIEVLGKHTDYAGGCSMLAAAERGFCVVFRARGDDHVRVTDALSGETAALRMQPDLQPGLGHWSNYPMTVARRVARNFPEARLGADVAFASDLPPAAGMSSSSAMLVAMFLVLADANRLWSLPEHADVLGDPVTLAGYLGTVENGQSFGKLQGDLGVGTFGGSEDHTAILCCRPGRISQYAYCPVRFLGTFPVPAGYVFAIGSSGVVAEKTGQAREKYNLASRLAAAVAALWRRVTGRADPHLAAAICSAPDAAARLRAIAAVGGEGFAPAPLVARLDQFLTENGDVLPAAGKALACGDLAAFGQWVDRSQEAAEKLLGNQVPETIHLAAIARRLGAAAASAFGAGFGGSVWALVDAADAEGFMARWGAAYRAEFPEHAASAAFFTTAAGPAAFRV